MNDTNSIDPYVHKAGVTIRVRTLGVRQRLVRSSLHILSLYLIR